MELAKVVRQRRENMHISQYELGKRAGVTPVFIMRFERGITSIRIGTLEALCEVFGCRVSDVIREAEDYAD